MRLSSPEVYTPEASLAESSREVERPGGAELTKGKRRRSYGNPPYKRYQISQLIIRKREKGLDNAIRDDENITAIRFASLKEIDDMIITIEDNGDEIPFEERDLIFDNEYCKIQESDFFIQGVV